MATLNMKMSDWKQTNIVTLLVTSGSKGLPYVVLFPNYSKMESVSIFIIFANNVQMFRKDKCYAVVYKY